jgi:hypothetical protein
MWSRYAGLVVSCDTLLYCGLWWWCTLHFFRYLGCPRLRFPTVGITTYLCNNASDLKCPIIIIQHEFLFLEHGLSDVDPHNVIVYNPFPWSPTITFLTLAALPHKTCFLTIRTVSFYTSRQNLLPKNINQPFGGSLRFFTNSKLAFEKYNQEKYSKSSGNTSLAWD